MKMKTKTYLMIVLVLPILNICKAVPNPVEKLWEEMGSAKHMMENIASQLDKFNSLYLMKLENRMMTLSNTLGHIDSNIKNLQERAHVWDTFQLHVSAWNEQIGTLDKKVDIISKGQEKMLILDDKINSIQSIEYKIERIFSKLESAVSTLQTMSKQLENSGQNPLLGEFTTRGVLSTLKTIERKLDTMQLQHASHQALLSKQLTDSVKKTDPEEQKGKLLIKCNTPPVVEELLTDVASKVDVLFDKFTGNEEQNDEEQFDDTSVDMSHESRNDPDLRLVRGLLKRMNQPCKRTVKVLENLESSIKVLDNTTYAILEDGQNMHSDMASKFLSHTDQIQRIGIKTDDLMSRFEEMMSFMSTKYINDQTFLSTLFKDQDDYFSSLFRSGSQTDSDQENSEHVETHMTNEEKEEEILEYFPVESATVSNKSGCDELNDAPSGIYIFQNVSVDVTVRNINVRYCDMSAGGGWTVIHNRGTNPEHQNFSLSWDKYKRGFGYLDKDFWFGNDFIHNLTSNATSLRIELENFEGVTAWAEYNVFSVASEDEKYQLHVGGYSGNASDSFSSHDNSAFSTYDRKNDNAPECCPCSASYGGGWWFNSCFEANLNGVYFNTPKPDAYEYFRGIIWERWLGNYSLRKAKMMIRPRTSDTVQTVETVASTTTVSDLEEATEEEEIPEDP